MAQAAHEETSDPVRIGRVEPDMNPGLVGFVQPRSFHSCEVELPRR